MVSASANYQVYHLPPPATQQGSQQNRETAPPTGEEGEQHTYTSWHSNTNHDSRLWHLPSITQMLLVKIAFMQYWCLESCVTPLPVCAGEMWELLEVLNLTPAVLRLLSDVLKHTHSKKIICCHECITNIVLSGPQSCDHAVVLTTCTTKRAGIEYGLLQIHFWEQWQPVECLNFTPPALLLLYISLWSVMLFNLPQNVWTRAAHDASLYSLTAELQSKWQFVTQCVGLRVTLWAQWQPVSQPSGIHSDLR